MTLHEFLLLTAYAFPVEIEDRDGQPLARCEGETFSARVLAHLIFQPNIAN